MSANVPANPIAIGQVGVVNAAAVRASDWRQIASAYDELCGMPAALVPMSMCYLPLPKSSLFQIPMRVWPRRAATHRIWFISIGFTAANQTANIAFRDPSLVTHNFQVTSLSSPSIGVSRLYTCIEKITSRTSGEVTLVPNIYTDASTAYLFGLGCYEITRPSIALGGNPITLDGGMDEDIIRSQLPICDGYQGDGAGYVAREIDLLRDVARRPGLWAWFGQVSTSSSSFSSVFSASPCALARGLHNGETQRTIQLAAYIAASAAGGGEIQWSMTSGASVTMPVPYTADGGYALVRAELMVDAEDITASDGRRSSRNDLCTVSFRAIAGTVTLYSLTAGEGVFSDPSSRAPSSNTIGATHLRRTFQRGPLPPFMSNRKKR